MMSDRSALQFDIVHADPDKVGAIREYLDQEYAPEMGDAFESTAVVGEHSIGAIEDDKIAERLIEIDPTVVFLIWQDPKFAYLGDVAMYAPELGLYVGPSDAMGNVVLTWFELEALTSVNGGDVARAFGRPWVDAIDALRPPADAEDKA